MKTYTMNKSAMMFDGWDSCEEGYSKLQTPKKITNCNKKYIPKGFVLAENNKIYK